MSTTNTMLRVRTSAKDRLRAIAQRKRWPLVTAFDAAVEQLEKAEPPVVPKARTGKRTALTGAAAG